MSLAPPEASEAPSRAEHMAEKTKEQEDPWKDAPKCCKGCVMWASFRKDCWYYWEGKKHCTMWANSWEPRV